MLYMKTRVTFRVAEDLAESLRSLPNQTAFVEAALREALRDKCPACAGSGRANGAHLRVSNLRRAALGFLERRAALQLRNVVILARHAAATDVRLTRARGASEIEFSVTRGEELLLRGALPAAAADAAQQA